jgi:replication factor C subunit 3/5
MFLIDKYTPKLLQEAYFHKKLLDMLQIMGSDESIPHMIFFGPEGSGKKTTINLFLEMIYDKDVHILEDCVYKVVGSSNKVTDVVVKQSNYHIIIEPNNNNFDRYLIQDIVKEFHLMFLKLKKFLKLF